MRYNEDMRPLALLAPPLRRRLQQWLARAQRAGLREPTAMALATADRAGRPSVRTVLLKGLDARGLVFYTNVHSRKGRALTANPRAALGFYWDPLRRQILVEGRVEPVSHREADAYWATRPRASQLAAWASQQSQVLDRRATLLARLAAARRRFAGHPVPRPPHWLGLRLLPARIEFWIARPNRLHERLCYVRRGRRWTRTLLYP